MKQIYITQGNHQDDIVQQVNDWLAEPRNASFTICDIQYSYSDGYSGVMVVYEINAG